METLSNLESFVCSAESGSFSAAARRLGLTPAAISRNVAQLERNLGVRFRNKISIIDCVTQREAFNFVEDDQSHK